MNRLIILIFLLIALAASPALSAERGADRPILVSQPAYKGMQFYVYRPENMPDNSQDWFLTYDGYPVYRNWNGVWLYGRFDGNGFVPTAHVVGSIVPSSAGLVPWGESPAAPLVAPGAVVNLNQLNSVNNYNYVNTAEWANNSQFTAIGGWGKSVDRIGVLTKPYAPVAWKGDKPEVIYIWTGQTWYQLFNAKKIRVADILRNKIYDLTVRVNKSGVKWRDNDTPALSRLAGSWGYRWLGHITLTQ